MHNLLFQGFYPGFARRSIFPPYWDNRRLFRTNSPYALYYILLLYTKRIFSSTGVPMYPVRCILSVILHSSKGLDNLFRLQKAESNVIGVRTCMYAVVQFKNSCDSRAKIITASSHVICWSIRSRLWFNRLSYNPLTRTSPTA